MSYQIDIEITDDSPTDVVAVLIQTISAALDALDCEPGTGLAVLLADDDYLRTLNRQFRQEDHATDVLSFPAGEPIPGAPETQSYLGDIAISVPYAQRQAERQGHSLLEEIQLLAVHGVLHLLGYDHATAEERTEMWHEQAAILGQLGLQHVQPTEGDSEP